MNSEVWYTARNNYDSEFDKEFTWEKYIKWSKLAHLSELVSLDGMLNGLTFESDFDSKEDWKYIITNGDAITGFFSSLSYVLDKTKDLDYFNLLAVVQEPKQEKADLANDFDFVGYDLIEKGGIISALTNCGGFDESFLPKDLNEFGLVTEYRKAKIIQENLKKNNPEEHHADCYMYEVWRHKIIGRRKEH